MRTVTRIDVDIDCLEAKTGGRVEEAAQELVEILLAEERMGWEEHQWVTATTIRAAYDAFLRSHPDARELRSSPDGPEIIAAVDEYLESHPPVSEEVGAPTDRDAAAKVLRTAVSILAQMPLEPGRPGEATASLSRAIEDRANGVLGLMFRQGDLFTIRLRDSEPEVLKAATARVITALAPRKLEDLQRLVTQTPTKHLARVTTGSPLKFHQIEMKTPIGELAQTGEVHAVGSRRRLLTYVAWKAPQRALLILSIALVAVDLCFQIATPAIDVGHLQVTDWIGGTLGRVSTAAFTAYLFAVLLVYGSLRSQFRRTSAAFIDWRVAGSDAGR